MKTIASCMFACLIPALASAQSAEQPALTAGMAPVALFNISAEQPPVVPAVAPTAQVAWDITGPSLTVVAGYTYRAFFDTDTVGVVMPAACAVTTGTLLFTCQSQLPALTVGTHTVQVSASNSDGAGPRSAVYTFRLVVLPAQPSNVRISGSL